MKIFGIVDSIDKLNASINWLESHNMVGYRLQWVKYGLNEINIVRDKKIDEDFIEYMKKWRFFSEKALKSYEGKKQIGMNF